MLETEDRGVHWCDAMEQFDEHQVPYFFTSEAVDTRTGREFVMIFMRMHSNGTYMVIQVEFCPFCGVLLNETQHLWRTRKQVADGIEKHLLKYLRYRRAFVHSGQVGEPLSRDKFNELMGEYEEITFLLTKAKDEHKEGLTRRQSKLASQLLTQVILPEYVKETDGSMNRVNEIFRSVGLDLGDKPTQI